MVAMDWYRHRCGCRCVFVYIISKEKKGAFDDSNALRFARALSAFKRDSCALNQWLCREKKGVRVNNIVYSLGGEKIDLILFSDDPFEYIARALSPAKVISVEIDEITKSARVIVPDDKLSLAIGKGGQNVRLAAKLTNWKIDVKSESKANQENNLTSNHTDVDDIGDIFSGTEDISLD